jgi:hypothetical protein
MSKPMEAALRTATASALRVTASAFDGKMTQTMLQPMPTLSETITFRITRPGDGVREFTLACTLTELSTTYTPPTTGWDF